MPVTWIGRLAPASNAADTDRAWLILTVHARLPAQAPPQAASVWPGMGTGTRRTTVPAAKVPVHVPVTQAMPAGTDVTRPLPVTPTVSVSSGVVESNRATQVIGWINRNAPLMQPSSPLQPPKVEPAAGTGVSTMVVSVRNGREQLAVQSTPPGELVTRPPPEPTKAIESE